MTGNVCGVCNTEPKKYKCPTCALPYCSLSCFKTHKTTHPTTAPSPAEPTEPSLPQPPPPAPTPRYLKKKTDFSVLATNPKFQALLKTHPDLLSSLQRVYAKTIEPDPEDEARRHRLERQAFRGRGSRGRGRGGRGGRWNSQDEEPRRWTPKKGDADAMRLLKGIREGKGREKEKEAMAEFVSLVEEVCGRSDDKEGDGV
ncbi:uncharacterized protein K460DRAFT_362917 [Cucurbitaria berberidis CBS 394.84]|uniref:HIT-type domain-containing protein n=1 Tax=Cucurbitaria berberidis CBS 394.84 TaxID=1168544 RepID=A0A9P4GV63_9PLEO|nr:uncharacterized protein K460DRAFT_362917 [Cucurbitaria berberidis CBS 394.84]KAF1852151.1 hypothetical protein K460DRAFT_362917 [Cucurbitaria berberidis CBS 394.84]